MDIKAVRKEFGLTQEEFAQKIGVSLSTVVRWETGRNKPSKLAVRRVEALARKSGFLMANLGK